MRSVSELVNLGKNIHLFFNKCRLVNCMHYIKCGVISSLLTEFWLLQKVCGTLDHCFIMTQYSQWGWLTNLLLCDIPWNKAPHAGRHIWRTYTLYPFSGREMNTDGSRVWWMISLATLVMATPESHNICCGCTWSSNQSGVGWSWLVPASSIKFLARRSLKSWWVYLAPHKDKRIQLLRAVRSRRWENSFVVHLMICRLIE